MTDILDIPIHIIRFILCVPLQAIPACALIILNYNDIIRCQAEQR
jgi:hypothetical protein